MAHRHDEVDIAPAPPWLLELLVTGGNGAAPAIEGDIPERERNSTLTSMAGTMRRRGFSGAAIAAALLTENRDRCKPPLKDTEVRKIARSVARYPRSDDAMATVDRLTELLGLGNAGKRIDMLKVFGRGSRGHVLIHLDNGERIVFDPLGPCATPAKMTVELASQAGATPTLKAPDVAEVVKLIYLLGEHHEAADIADRAWELGASYLRSPVSARS